MRKIKFTFIIIISLPLICLGQIGKNYAKNPSRKDNDQKITIEYTLPNNKRISTYFVELIVKAKGKKIEPKNVEGDGGNISPGIQTITWVYTRENINLRDVLNNYDIEVFARRDEYQPIDNKELIIATAGVGTLGLTLVGAGFVNLSKNSKKNSDYQTYESIKNPNDPIWQELGYSSRDDLYDTINGKYKTGQYLTIGGFFILGGGVYLLNQLSNKDRIIKKGTFISPQMEIFGYKHSYTFRPNIGIKVGIRF